MKTELLKKYLTEEDRKYYESANRGWKVDTLDCVKIIYDDGTECVYPIFKGKFTRQGMLRDCGDHYELARYSDYLEIPKN